MPGKASDNATLWTRLDRIPKSQKNGFFLAKWRARMRELALTILTVSLLSVPAVAQSNDSPLCPAGYYLAGRLCHDSSTGDVVLPDRHIMLPNGDIVLPNN